MNDILKKILAWVKQLGYLAQQYAYTILYWKLRFFKVQVQKCKKCGEQKKLDKVNSSLGAEIYALYKQGETDWQKMPSVQQQLKFAEEAEARVFQFDEAIEEINNEYLNKKAELQEKYAAKRASVSESETRNEE